MVARWFGTLAVLGAGLLLAGCGGGDVKRYPAGGTVIHNGEPVPDAVVTFVPVENGITAEARTDGEGKFTLASAGKPGVPAGRYQVGVVATEGGGFDGGPNATDEERREAMMNMMLKGPSSPPKDRVPRKYADPGRSGITVEVTTDASNNDFELNLAP